MAYEQTARWNSEEQSEKPRKPFHKRASTVRTTSRRYRAGSRKNKRYRNVGSFASDKAVTS